MKKIILFLSVIFVATMLKAQDKIADSLKTLLYKEATDTGRVQLLIELGRRFGYGYSKNDSSLGYLQQALDLSKKINYHAGEREAEYNISQHYYFSGNYPEALKISLQNLQQSETAKDTFRIFWQTRLTSWIYREIGDYRLALKYADRMRSMSDAEFRNDSLMHYRSVTIANASIGVSYELLNMLDSSLYFRQLFYQSALKGKTVENLALATNWLGDTYLKMHKNDSAFHFYKINLPYAIASRRFDIVASSEPGLAELFHSNEQSDSAFYYARKALDQFQTLNTPHAGIEADSLLSTLFKKRHQYDSAYKYLHTYITLKDSLFNQQKIVEAQNFSFSDAMQQQQLTQAKKDAEQEYNNRLKFYSLGTIIFIFLIIAFLLNKNLRNKRKANLLLQSQKEEIESTLSELKSTQSQLIQSEKMASLGELTAGIAHEIQNPLNFVNNFSEVNKEMIDEATEEMDKGNIDEAKNILNDIKGNEEKINHHGKRADAIVKGMLQHSRSSTGVKEPTNINALAHEYLRLAYHGLRAKDKDFNAVMKTDFDHAIGKINIVPQDIGRVLLNLYNNAFYAVGERKKAKSLGYEPTVSVTTKKSGNQATIAIRDNGNGIPQKILDKIFQPFFTTKPTGQGTGLGLSLSYDIIKAHGGEIKANTKEGEFTEFIILLPFV